MKTYTRSIEDLDAGKLPEWKNLAVRCVSQALIILVCCC